MGNKVAIIIPVLNEEGSIIKVLNDIPEIFKNKIVVDNGSVDLTPQIVSKTSATLLFEKRRGYGSACMKGINFIKENLPETDIVVFLDGDYSDYPEEIDKLLKPILEDGFDFVVGARMDKQFLTPQSIFGNWLATRVIDAFWNFRYTDLGPFRAIKFNKLLQLDMKDKDYGWTVEMQIKAILNNLKVKEIPVCYRKRIGRSKISGTVKGTILAGYKILKTIFMLKLNYSN